jgi:hypothetical protein
VAEITVEPDSSGAPQPEHVATGDKHKFVVRVLELYHCYHDDDPVQDATFKATFPNGLEVVGKLNKQGKATLIGVPDGAEVRYGPDQREYKRADDRKNPDHRENLSDGQADALFAKYGLPA